MPGYEIIGEEEKNEILDVLSRKMLFRYEFDEQRAGTAALRVALAALGIGPGDEVITQGFTFVATWEAILDTGAIPVFAEIDDTLCLDPEDLAPKISSRTRAIIPVHMCGAQARIKDIVAIADSHGIPVLEDTAQSCGGRLGGKALGSFGKMGTFSFDSVKTLTTGEGGMIITNDEELYIRASEYHDHGHDHDPNVGRGLEKRNFIGINYRMMELQGALGLAQLKKLDNTILKRQKENKSRIKDALSKIDQITFRDIPDPDGDSATFVIFLLPTVEKAKEFNRVITEQGVGTVYWYENDWHYFERWEHLLESKSLLPSGYPFKQESGETICSYQKSSLPRTAELLSRALTIQINLNMDEQLPKIIAAIEKAGDKVI